MRTTRNLLLPVLLAASCLFLMFGNLPAQESAAEQFEKALYYEDVQGDLQRAIELYEQILKQFPGNREIAAKAQLHIGLCYEKLGLQEAPKAYQRVLDDFPEQKEVVRIAQQKLSVFMKAKTALEKAGGELNMRKVWAGTRIDILGEVSPDGKYLCFTDWDTGDLAIRDLATGKNRRITDKGPWTKSMAFAMFPKWSPDEQSLAYVWFNPKTSQFELHLVGLKDSQPRILFKNGEDDAYVQPFDWHPDNKHILVGIYKRESMLEIGFLSVVDKTIRIVKTFKGNMSANRGGISPWGFVISPDGRTIAYDYRPEKTSNNRDIFLLSSEGTNEQKLFDHPAFDFVCNWTADGRHLLFASDRTGDLGLWAVQMEGEKPLDAPILIKADMGMFASLGCTQQNQLYVGYQKEGYDIYLAEIDPVTGQFSAPPIKQVRLYEGCNAFPEFSPDGKYLTYTSIRVGAPRNTYSLCVYSFERNEVREIDTGLEVFSLWSYPQWKPDGQAISLIGRDRQGRWGIHLIDLESETSSPLVLYGENETMHRYRWAKNGQTLFYTKGPRRNSSDQQRSSMIYSFDLKTGQEKVLPGSPDDACDIDISPDGKWLVDLNRGFKRTMRIIPTTGGDPQDLFSFDMTGTMFISPAWSADGKYIYFSTKSDISNPEWDMWRFSLEEKKAEKINLNTVSFRHLSPHPDGRHVIFSTENDSTRDSEIWVLENFLPKKK